MLPRGSASYLPLPLRNCTPSASHFSCASAPLKQSQWCQRATLKIALWQGTPPATIGSGGIANPHSELPFWLPLSCDYLPIRTDHPRELLDHRKCTLKEVSISSPLYLHGYWIACSFLCWNATVSKQTGGGAAWQRTSDWGHKCWSKSSPPDQNSTPGVFLVAFITKTPRETLCTSRQNHCRKKRSAALLHRPRNQNVDFQLLAFSNWLS